MDTAIRRETGALFPGVIICGFGEKNVVYRTKKEVVIANQSADWCGNPPTFQDTNVDGIPVFRTSRKIRGIATPVCALARNDSVLSGVHA